MSERNVGIVNVPGDPRAIVDGIKGLEDAGIPAVWLTTGAPGADALTIFSAAAAITDAIKMGTAITPTWGQHPVYSVQQIQVIANLAPGRLRFGVGPSGKGGMIKTYGANFRRPVTNMREYIQIARSLLQTGTVDFQGSQYIANASIGAPISDVPVIGSALGTGAFRACGEVADGAISWLCPPPYLRDYALPALKEGATNAGRETPPLIAHFVTCLHEDVDEVRAAVRQDFTYFASAEYYINMFAAAGFPGVSRDTGLSDELIDSFTFYGDQNAIASQIQALFDDGADEVYASIVTPGPDPVASRQRTIAALSEINKSL